MQQENLTQLRNNDRLETGLAWLDLIAVHDDDLPVRYYTRLPEYYDHILKSDDTWITLDIAVHNKSHAVTPKRTAYRQVRFNPEGQNQDPMKLITLPQSYTYWFNIPLGPTANLGDFKAIHFSPLIFRIMNPTCDSRPEPMTIRLTINPSLDDILWLGTLRDNPRRHRCMYINCSEMACCPTLLTTTNGGEIAPHKHCTSFFCPRCFEMCPINSDI